MLGFNAPARHLDVFTLQCGEDVVDCQRVAAKAHRIHPDADLPRAITDEGDAAYARHALEARLDLLVRELRERADGLRARQHDREDRGRVGIDPIDHRGIRFGGQVAARRRHLVPHVLGLLMDVVVELELDHQLGKRIARGAAQRSDALDRVDRLLERLRELALYGLWGGALQHRHHGHHGKLDAGHEVDAEPRDRHETEHDECADEHHGEDRPPNRRVGELHVEEPPAGWARTRIPGAIVRAASPTITSVPASSPEITSTASSVAMPMRTGTGTARPSRTVKTRVSPSSVRTASGGISKTSESDCGTMSTCAKTPAFKFRSAFGTSIFTR